MRLTWVELLSYGVLKEARVVAGARGLEREIKSISVYDVLPPKDFAPNDEGVLYISTFEQFANKPEALMTWIKDLNNNRVAGICTMHSSSETLSQEVIKKCDELGFPIISVYDDLPYFEIIEAVSTLLVFEKRNSLKEEKLKQILYTRQTFEEEMTAISFLNRGFKSQIKVIAIEGEFDSMLSYKEMNTFFDSREEDTYLQLDENHIIILSASDAHKLEKKQRAIMDFIKTEFKNYTFGISKTLPLIDMDMAVNNAFTALKIAKLNKNDVEEFDDFSDLALLLPLANSKEYRHFHEKFVQLMETNDPQGKMEYIRCVKEYVKSGGCLQVVAESLCQHEATIRYRLNRVKSILGLEENTVKFYETIALFTAIDDIKTYYE